MSTKHPHRHGVLAVHSLHDTAFSVPDIDEAERFYTAFGLDCRRDGDRLALHTFGSPHRWATLWRNPGPKQFRYLAFACFAEDLAGIAERADALGVPRCDPHPAATPEGIWLRHPDGFPVQVIVADKTMPDTASLPVLQAPADIGRGRAPLRSQVAVVRPRRLAHVLLFSPDVDRSVAFYEDVLGLRTSDRAGDGIAFLHGVHGSDHHLVATARSEGPGLHHLSWDVASADEVGLGMAQMQAAGHGRGWGVGRHVLGSNVFHYVRDPWGSYSEYSFDIDYIPAHIDWAPGNHAPHDAFYLWGPETPADFITNHEPGQAP